jgi:hypothetical protein
VVYGVSTLGVVTNHLIRRVRDRIAARRRSTA